MNLGLGLAIRSLIYQRSGSAPAWTPASLFASSEEGGWYYIPDDLSTLWQDTAGTTPVTATGQSVARWDDSSGNGNHLTQGTGTKCPTLQQDAGGKYYLDFDGGSDAFATATIDLTSSTKFTVIAGIWNDQTTAAGVVIESGSNASNGVPALFAPASGAANVGYRFRTAGTGTVATASMTALAPHVVVGMSDSVSGLVSTRVDGVQSADVLGNMADQAALNQPLYVGGRDGTGTYFNGRMYGLIWRNAATYTDTLLSAESWMADKSGVTLAGTDPVRVGVGAWTWFNEPSAIDVNGKAVFGASGPYTGTSIYAFSEDYGAVALGDETVDDHSNPSFIVRSQDNKVIALWSGHNVDDTYIAVSSAANSATAFGSATDLASSFGLVKYSYTNPVQLGDETNDPIYTFYRADVVADNAWTIYFSKSTDGGATWDAGTKLINSDTRPYIRVVKTAESRFDICVSDGQPNEVTNNIYHLYYDGTWRNSAGTDIGSPPFDYSDFTKVHDASSVSGWHWDLQIDSTGAPCILYATFTTTTNHRYNFARWNGSSWDTSEICAGGTYLYATEEYYSGGMCMNPDNPFEVIASVESGGVWDLYKFTSSDSGATWSAGTQITDLPYTHTVRPRFVKGSSTKKIVYFSGTYTSYTSYANCRIFLETIS